MFKVIIAGGRDFVNYQFLVNKCDSLLKNKTDIEIVSGGAKGADKCGELYAQDRNFELKVFPANWKKYGVVAGFIRNKDMAKQFFDC